MHFWIGERASQYHHHGRRQRPPLYSGQFFGTGFGGRRGDKPFGQWNRRPSSSIVANTQSQQSSSSSTIASTSSIPSSSTSTSMVTPVHRFQTLGAQTVTSNSNTPDRDRLSVGSAGVPVGDLSPNSTRTRGSGSDAGSGGYYGNVSRYQQQQQRSRSRDRPGSSDERQRRRRSSSSRRYRDRNSNSVGSNEAAGTATGGVTTTSSTNSELRDSSFSSSEESSTLDCNRTKRIGVTLCFMGFILLCTVGAKFVFEGPGIIDISRRDKSETTAYFFLTELIFVAFAMALFFTGVACLRKRTNDYLLRQFNQHILHGASNQRGISDDLSNSEILYDPIIITTVGDNPEHHPPVVERNSLRASYPHPSYGLSSITTPINHNCMCRHSPSHHSYHHHHHHLSSVFGPSTTLGHVSRHGHAHAHAHTHHHGNGGSRRCPYLTSHSNSVALMQRQQPPPYHIALYLPLPSTTAATTATSPGHHSATVTVDSCEIIEECPTVQVIGRDRDSCSLSLNKENGSTNEGDIPTIPPKESGSSQVNEEGDERLTSPETPPPSYEQFFLRL